jgi:hypothetical protein
VLPVDVPICGAFSEELNTTSVGGVLGEGDDENDALRDELADIEGDADLLTLTDTEGEAETEIDGDKLTDIEGVTLADALGAKSVNSIHDNAPSSPFVPPVHVNVCVAAVVDFHVVCLKPPTSASISSPATDHVFATVSAAHPATASIPPPAAIVCDPVVSGSVVSISVD